MDSWVLLALKLMLMAFPQLEYLNLASLRGPQAGSFCPESNLGGAGTTVDEVG